MTTPEMLMDRMEKDLRFLAARSEAGTFEGFLLEDLAELRRWVSARRTGFAAAQESYAARRGAWKPPR